MTSLRVAPDQVYGVCFDVDGLGAPLSGTLMPMELTFETLPGGAQGGEITLVERSMLGSCSVRVPVRPGTSAEEIAAEVAAAFQEDGVPGPDRCPAVANPRDVVADGKRVTTALASNLVLCIDDPGVGYSLQPEKVGAPIFIDGFESGDTSAWSSASP